MRYEFMKKLIHPIELCSDVRKAYIKREEYV